MARTGKMINFCESARVRNNVANVRFQRFVMRAMRRLPIGFRATPLFNGLWPWATPDLLCLDDGVALTRRSLAGDRAGCCRA